MTDAGPPPPPPVPPSPHAWITPDVFRQFLAERNVSPHCELCSADNWFIDVGGTGYIPRSSAFPNNWDGTVNTAGGFHMPIIRAICMNCGNVRQQAVFILEQWRSTGTIPSHSLSKR